MDGRRRRRISKNTTTSKKCWEREWQRWYKLKQILLTPIKREQHGRKEDVRQLTLTGTGWFPEFDAAMYRLLCHVCLQVIERIKSQRIRVVKSCSALIFIPSAHAVERWRCSLTDSTDIWDVPVPYASFDSDSLCSWPLTGADSAFTHLAKSVSKFSCTEKLRKYRFKRPLQIKRKIRNGKKIELNLFWEAVRILSLCSHDTFSLSVWNDWAALVLSGLSLPVCKILPENPCLVHTCRAELLWRNNLSLCSV